MSACLLLATALFGQKTHAETTGPECIGWNDLTHFVCTTNLATHERTWTSPVIEAGSPFTELVLSWNLDLPSSLGVRFEAAAIQAGRDPKFYQLGEWTGYRGEGVRRSIKGQKDVEAEVQTDTLVFHQEVGKFQVRMKVTGPEKAQPRVRLVAVSLSKPKQRNVAPAEELIQPHLIPHTGQLCQLDYEGGQVWCSPTSVTMILRHWSAVLGRPDLAVEVPFTASEVYDPNWPGTGNWSFNMAFAGSFPGMRAYAARLDSLQDLAAWTALGIPVATSVCYNRLRGIEGRSSGHLVVCVGFDKNGDVILNDPGSKTEGRKTVNRDRFLHAWAHSNQTVYLIHPESSQTPTPSNGKWLPAR